MSSTIGMPAPKRCSRGQTRRAIWWSKKSSEHRRRLQEVQIASDRCASLADAVVGSQIHLLVFDAAPQPLDEDVIPPRTLAVHADRNAVVGEYAGEGRAGELRALVGIEDVRPAVTRQGILQRLDAERRFHRDRYAP